MVEGFGSHTRVYIDAAAPVGSGGVVGGAVKLGNRQTSNGGADRNSNKIL